MNQVFRYLGYSKQRFHQKLDRMLKEKEQQSLLLPIIAELRFEHPEMAARELYLILRPDGIGRDKFERLCFENGYKLPRKRSLFRTTDSTGVIRFPNLLAGREFTQVNQAWASDITYFQIGDCVYYLTFILDLCSRVIVGYSVSKRLLTEETTLPALLMAIENFKPPAGLIFHSDGGGQYYSKSFLQVTQSAGFKNSMCDAAYENPFAERVNGTIKNQYLKGYNPDSYEALIKQTARAVRNYNLVRPHKSLGKLTPLAYYYKKMPAGGASLPADGFCNPRTKTNLYKKNHHQPKRLTLSTSRAKGVEKTVNVF